MGGDLGVTEFLEFLKQKCFSYVLLKLNKLLEYFCANDPLQYVTNSLFLLCPWILIVIFGWYVRPNDPPYHPHIFTFVSVDW